MSDPSHFDPVLDASQPSSSSGSAALRASLPSSGSGGAVRSAHGKEESDGVDPASSQSIVSDAFPLGEDLHPASSSYLGGREDSATHRPTAAPLAGAGAAPLAGLRRSVSRIWRRLVRRNDEVTVSDGD